MTYHLHELDLLAPEREAALQPLFWNAPLPAWGGNAEAAGPPLLAAGGLGSACMGCGLGAAAAEPSPTLNIGHVALGAAGGLLVGLLIGWVAKGERCLRPNYRRNGRVVRFRRARYHAPKGSRPGSGERFRALSSHLAHRRGKSVRDPKALAAYIGRKKYGKARFQEMAAAGRRRGAHHRAAA